MDDRLMTIPKNPPQTPPSLFRVTRSLKVRGDAIYIIFGGVGASVMVFFVAMDTALLLALGIAWMPLAASVWFYFHFVRGKPRYYIDYTVNALFGRDLVSPSGENKKIRRHHA